MAELFYARLEAAKRLKGAVEELQALLEQLPLALLYREQSRDYVLA